MNQRSIKTLEFNKILQELLKYSSTFLGRALSSSTKISKDAKEIQQRLDETTQMQDLILQIGNPPLAELVDITNSLKKSKLLSPLSFSELLNVAHFLKVSRELKEYFVKEDKLNLSQFNLISQYFTELYSNIRIESLILDNILDEETISDKASSNLLSIRNSIRNTENKIKDTLNNYIRSPLTAKYLQDAVITIKMNRYVLPVKQEYRSQVSGIVHDTSASGSTLFIEPSAVVDLNNKIKVLKGEELLEIEKIVLEYTSEIQKIEEQITGNIDLIANIDFIAAKAKYSLKNNMFPADINTNKYINLIDARHPLIDSKKVVPISLSIDDTHNCMIITGPNTGGKTVTLKTIGLLTLMTQYGMHIPAKEHSNIAIFDDIFTDIGDEQSIEQNLSTFSSHMTNIINIVKNASNNSLVILDELGSGTDPVEGAALAIGILEHLNNLNGITLCTTHYSELKTYAMSKSNILNACCEFDLKTLKPTYRLIVGIPGKSNAFAISEKLGLNKEIIETASSYITKDIVDFETILAKINAERSEIEKIKRNIQSEYSRMKNDAEKLAVEKQTLENQKSEIISSAKLEARNLLLNSKEELNEMIDEIYKLKTQDTKNIQKKKKEINEKLNSDTKKLSSNNGVKKFENISLTIQDLKLGQDIFIPHLNANGNVLKINNENSIYIQVGIIKTTVKISEIQLQDISKDDRHSSNKVKISNKAKSISSSINLLGKNVDEAIYELEKYLDDAYLANISTVSIVHGKGTGKLKDGIHSYLKTCRYVESFRLGNYHEGQTGVTIIEIKK